MSELNLPEGVKAEKDGYLYLSYEVKGKSKTCPLNLSRTEENIKVAILVLNSVKKDVDNEAYDSSKAKYRKLKELLLANAASVTEEPKSLSIKGLNQELKNEVLDTEKSDSEESVAEEKHEEPQGLAQEVVELRALVERTLAKVKSLEESQTDLEDQIAKLKGKVDSLSSYNDTLETRLAKCEHELEPPSAKELEASGVPSDLTELVQKAEQFKTPFRLTTDLGLDPKADTGKLMRLAKILKKKGFKVKQWRNGHNYYVHKDGKFE